MSMLRARMQHAVEQPLPAPARRPPGPVRPVAARSPGLPEPQQPVETAGKETVSSAAFQRGVHRPALKLLREQRTMTSGRSRTRPRSAPATWN